MMDNKKHLWIFYVLFYSLAILLVDGPLLFSSARMTSAPGCDVWIFWHDFNDWCVSDLAGGGWRSGSPMSLEEPRTWVLLRPRFSIRRTCCS